ncbi:MAG: accessory factor UbiK family protein [Pseudomonadota bacterium]
MSGDKDKYTDNKFFDDMARMASGAMGTIFGLREEFEAQVRQQVERIMQRLDLVSREDFDAMSAVAQDAKIAAEEAIETIARLEKRIAELEKPAAKTATKTTATATAKTASKTAPKTAPKTAASRAKSGAKATDAAKTATKTTRKTTAASSRGKRKTTK